MKKVITFAFAVVLVFGLLGMAACGSDSDPKSDNGGASSAPEGPVAMGASAQVGYWDVTVTDFVADATDTVLDANEFNDGPGEGWQYALVTLEATYTGEETESFWLDIDYKLATTSGDTYEGGVATMPGDIRDFGNTSPGETISGYIVFGLPSSQVDGVTLKLAPQFDFDGDLSKAVFTLE